MKPGGWCENAEITGETSSDHHNVPQDSPAKRWADLMVQGITMMGRNMRPYGEDIKKIIEEVGFVDVVLKSFKIPVGT